MTYNSLRGVNLLHLKQDLLNRIMKMRDFRPLYIKLCSTTDYSWIETLSSVIDKIELSHDKKEITQWILSECELYEDIKDSALSRINNNCCIVL